MNEINKVLIEQALYGFANTELMGEDLLVEAVNHYIDNPNPDYTLSGVFTESIAYSYDFMEFQTIIEAADNVKAVSRALKQGKKESEESVGLMQRMGESLKKLFYWWYKIDPDKKMKWLKPVLSILMNAVTVTVGFKFGKYIDTSGQKDFNTNYFLNLADKFIIRRTPLKGILTSIGDLDPVKKVTRPFALSSKATVDLKVPAISIKKGFHVNTWNINIIGLCFTLIAVGLKKLDSELYYQVNVKDIDANIDKIDKSIDKLIDEIEDEENPERKKTLQKAKKNAEDALAALMHIKDLRNTRKQVKETAEYAKNMIFTNAKT